MTQQNNEAQIKPRALTKIGAVSILILLALGSYAVLRARLAGAELRRVNAENAALQADNAEFEKDVASLNQKSAVLEDILEKANVHYCLNWDTKKWTSDCR